MSLPIKLFVSFLFLMFFHHSFSQEENFKFPQDDHYGIFKIGYVQPIGIGDNFANKSFTNSTGFDLEFSFNLFDTGFLLGLRYGNTYNKIKNRELTGGQDKTNSYFIGPLIGYQFLARNDFRYTLSAGVGSVEYKNFFQDNVAKDSGSTIWISPEIDYHFNKHFGLFFSPTFQKDFLDIEAPEEIEDFFKTANYIKLQLGIRVVI